MAKATESKMYGAYIETITDSGHKGTEGVSVRRARQLVQGHRESGMPSEITGTEEEGTIRVFLPGAIGLTYIYHFPVG